MTRVFQALNRAEREGAPANGELPEAEPGLLQHGPPASRFVVTDVMSSEVSPVEIADAGTDSGFAPASRIVPGMPASPQLLEEIGEIERVLFIPRNDSHVVLHDPRHRAAAESFRLLRYRLEKLRERQPITSILIASAIPKEGKTLVAINLASALALTSTRVLLVDADLRRPGITPALGLRALPGLTEVLQDKMTLRAAYRRVDPLGFYLLPAGRVPTNPVELLQSTAMRALMNHLTAAFDWVLLDSPPLLPFADGHCLASLCNGVLMVAREATTTKEALQEALGSLKAAHIIGTILNDAQTQKDGEYYYGYAKRNGAARNKAPDLAEPPAPAVA